MVVNQKLKFDLDLCVILHGYIHPFIAIITLIVNIFIIIVLNKKNMMKKTNLFLSVIAVCDILTVVLPSKFKIMDVVDNTKYIIL